MPENVPFKTEIYSTTEVLLVDEIGNFVSLLTDFLLSRGFKVNYFGKEKRETFDYLSGKDNFVYLNSLPQYQKAPLFEAEMNGSPIGAFGTGFRTIDQRSPGFQAGESSQEGALQKFDYIYFFPKNDLGKIKEILPLLQTQSGRLLIATSKHFPGVRELEELVESKELNLKWVLFDEVFGKRVAEGEMADIFISVLKGGRTEINGAADDLISPVYSESLIREVLKVSFLPGRRGKVCLIKSRTITWEDFTAQIKAFFPGSDFVFLGSKDKVVPGINLGNIKEIVLPDSLEINTEETIEWFQRQRSLFQQRPAEETTEIPKFYTQVLEEVREEIKPESQEVAIDNLTDKGEPVEEKPVSGENLPLKITLDKESKDKSRFISKLFKTFLFFLLFIFLFFVLPLGISFIYGVKGLKTFQAVRADLIEGRFETALKNEKNAVKSLKVSQQIFSLISPFYSLVGLAEKTNIISKTFDFTRLIGESIGSALTGMEVLSQGGEKFLKGETTDWAEVQETIRTNFSFAYQQASLAQALSNEVQLGFDFFKKRNLFEEMKQYLPVYRENLLKGQNLAIVLPEVIGAEERKTYLVLFQNNLELRPTGGFISAIGLMNLENGKLVNFEVKDIYKVDSLLKGQVDPPQRVKDVLGEEVWYFRDANFDPEFSYTANKALWFLDKELNITADGVVAVNLKTLSALLGKIGKVEVGGYRDKIDADNLFVKILQYSEVIAVDGKQDKEEFIVSLIKAIYEKIKLMESKDMNSLLGIIFSQLETKEIMAYFVDQKIERQIVDLNWDGNFRQYRGSLKQYSVLEDFLHLNEANVGINKVNYFLKRKVDHQIGLDENGLVKQKLVIFYENQSVSDNWPAGKYKNYLRVYLPDKTSLVSALLYDVSSPSINLLGENDPEVFDERGRAVFGFLFEIPAQAKMKLEIEYQLDQVFDFANRVNSYLLIVPKQSGVYSDEYDLSVFYPQTMIPLRVIPKAVIKEGKLAISEKIDRDKVFQIDLARQ